MVTLFGGLINAHILVVAMILFSTIFCFYFAWIVDVFLTELRFRHDFNNVQIWRRVRDMRINYTKKVEAA